MATIIRERRLANVVDQADIIILERDEFGEMSHQQISEGDPVRTLMKSKKWSTGPANVEGRMLKISDDRKIAIFCCTRRYGYNSDPLMQFLPMLVGALVEDNRSYSFGLNSLYLDSPSTFSGTVVLCVSLSLQQENNIVRLFESWSGTVYLINLQE